MTMSSGACVKKIDVIFEVYYEIMVSIFDSFSTGHKFGAYLCRWAGRFMGSE